MRQGQKGEVAVGQYLEFLRKDGALIYHDIPGDGFNLDHVVIASSGVYVIETKTYSKPDSGKPKIQYSGSSLTINDSFNTDKPIIQVKAAASWLSHLIQESAAMTIKPKPVVVFPGWFIESTPEAKNSDVWVLNPKALPTYIRNSSDTLTKEAVSMIGFNISRYIRNKAKENL